MSFTIVAALFLAVGLTSASPTGRNVETTIKARFIQSINDCGDNEAKVKQDFADAAAFGLTAYDEIDENSNAFKHYFRTSGDGLTTDLEMAQQMWSTIASNNDPTNAPYTFTVRCAAQDDQECASRTTESFAITDAEPEVNGTPRQIKICPKYFTDATTKLSTTSKEYKVNPGRRDNSWCQPGNKFKDFSVGGITLLHEMTHLDALAAAASYPAVHDDGGDFDTHATEDVVGVNPQNNPPIQSRNLAQIWQQGKEGDYDDLVEPYRNAESIADAAFEAYVMKLCQLDNIDV